MNNQEIGIGGVFAFTLLLFALRYLFLSIGQRNRTGCINPTTPGRDRESNIDAGDDHAWLFWNQEQDTRAGPSGPGLRKAPRN